MKINKVDVSKSIRTVGLLWCYGNWLWQINACHLKILKTQYLFSAYQALRFT